VATIHDVAAAAGVSPATVSRVLNRPEIVAAEKVARVRAAIDELGFQRSVVARDLRLRSSHTIALLVADISQPSQAALAKSVERRAEKSGYAVMLGDLDHRQERLLNFLREIPSRGLAGVLIATGDDLDKSALAEAIRHVEERGVRVVTLARAAEVPDVPMVTFESQRIGQDAAAHLLEQGRSQLLFLSGGKASWHSRALESGVRQAVKRASASLSVIDGQFQHKPAYTAVVQLLEQGVRPAGIIAATTPMALGAVRALGEAGLAVPADVGVVVCQNEPLAEYVTPSLTAVGGDVDLHGERAVDALLRRIAGDPVGPPTILQHSLIPRESTGVVGLHAATPVPTSEGPAPELGRARSRRAG
jgi:DNA-binding LacI/PurR family transcriptional regulator